MRPVDPRLLRYARSTRGFLVLVVVLGVFTAGLVIAQARLLATAIVEVAQGRADLGSVSGVIVGLAAVVGLRAVVAWAAEVAAYRTSARAKADLREAALDHVLRMGPAGPASRDTGGTATLITRGIDALDAYYARYLPQLVLAVIVPLAIIATIVGQDLLSALIIAVTLPIIVVFMVLIGLYTRSRVQRQWSTLSRLSGHFLDLVAGLSTLKVLGRAGAQARAIREMGDRYRSATMRVLRVSFLSSFALELLASLSVALVAVTIGVRLVEGGIDFSTALFILILAPEAYLPLRLLGQHFHAAGDGLGAADELFTILEQPLPTGGTRTDLPDRPTIAVSGLSVTYPGRESPALWPTSFIAGPGQVIALVGSSGGGKSTLLAALLGFVPIDRGMVEIRGAASRAEGIDLVEVDADRWRTLIAWVPQEPRLVAPGIPDRPSVVDIVRVGRPDASIEDVRAALRSAGILDELEAMPEGLSTPLAEDGSGLSAGQRRRIALARALVRPAPLLLLDEPTAALDGASEAAVIAAITGAARAGRTVIVVAHRPAIVECADVIVHVAPPADRRIVDEPHARNDVSTPVPARLPGSGW